MRATAKLGVCLLAVTTTIVGIPPAAQARAAPAGPLTVAAAKNAPAAPDRTLTLITGDHLQVSADGRSITRLPTPGRDKIQLLSRTVDDHLEVVPEDAVALLNAGTLDRRLFDVTQLLAFGYDDKRGNLPLIVTYAQGAAGTSALRAKAVTPSTPVSRELPSINGAALTVDRDQAAGLWAGLTTGTKTLARSLSPGYRKVWLDGLRTPTLDVSVPLVGAPVAWSAGYTGDAVGVGILDSGIDDTHPDLAGKVVEAKNFTTEPDTLDHVGHGTHVASIIAGSGAASDGKYKGVAPGAKLYSGKICVSTGGGEATCPDSWILAAMEWAARDKHLRVVNMSLGTDDAPGIDPVEEAVNTLSTEYGTLFVIAGGNSGLQGQPVGSPASADEALAVAATDKNDNWQPWSNRGPRIGGNGIKPDLAAPGLNITAAYGAGTFGTPVGPDGRYTVKSGTSMATPHVAGAAAILAQQHPEWTGRQLKAALMESAASNGRFGVDMIGAGRLDVGRAVKSTLLAQPASIDFGVNPGPHADDPVVTKQVTYHNAGATDVTLALATSFIGAAPPPGMFTTSAASLTVPAGSDATASVTVDPRVSGPDVRYSGALVATGDGMQVRTVFAMQKDKETFELTVNYRNRSGDLTPRVFSGLYHLNGSGWEDLFDPSGVVKRRVEPGTYTLDAKIFDDDGSTSLLNQPKLVITGDTTVDMDARLGKPITITGLRPGATQDWAHVAFTFPTEQGGHYLGNNLDGTTFATMYVAQIGRNSDMPGFLGDIAGSWSQLGKDGATRNSPYVYNMAWYQHDKFFNGFTKRVGPWNLATINADYAANATGSVGVRFAKFMNPIEPYVRGWYTRSVFDLPIHRVEYYNTDDGVLWNGQFAEGLPAPAANSTLYANLTAYKPGKSYTETWNLAVLSPAFPEPEDRTYRGIKRSGNTLAIYPSLFSDAAGHDSYVSERTSVMTVSSGDASVTVDDDIASITVPAAEHTYTIKQSSTRIPENSPLTQRIDVAWTFTSAETPSDTATPLPLSVFRFAPRVDNTNTAPIGLIDPVPFTVQRQPGSAAGAPKTLTVQASVDDGRTWKDVQVFGAGDARLALVVRPPGHGFVSLKGASVDTAGNKVEQTIIHAYRY
jgi:subtilisin family serine protease